jgi:hypothetical protein
MATTGTPSGPPVKTGCILLASLVGAFGGFLFGSTTVVSVRIVAVAIDAFAAGCCLDAASLRSAAAKGARGWGVYKRWRVRTTELDARTARRSYTVRL